MAKTPEEILAEAEAQKKAGAETQPAETAFNIDNRIAEMLARDAADERAREEARTRRQLVARSLSDLGSSIVDMIKGSEGAVVSPRQVEQHYQRLDDRQKQIYDTYRARMDLSRKMQMEAAQKRAAAEERAKEKEEAGRLRKEEMQTRKEIAQMQEEGRNQRAEEANKAAIQKIREQAAARIQVKQTPSGDMMKSIPFGGQDYFVNKNVYDARMAALYAYLDENNLFPEASQAGDDLKNVMALFSSGNGSKAAESSIQRMAIAVNVALANLGGNSEHAKNIIDIINGTYGQQTSTTKPAAATQQKQKKSIPGVNGN